MAGNVNLIRESDEMGMKICSIGNENESGNIYTGMGENGTQKPIYDYARKKYRSFLPFLSELPYF